MDIVITQEEAQVICASLKAIEVQANRTTAAVLEAMQAAEALRTLTGTERSSRRRRS